MILLREICAQNNGPYITVLNALRKSSHFNSHQTQKVPKTYITIQKQIKCVRINLKANTQQVYSKYFKQGKVT